MAGEAALENVFLWGEGGKAWSLGSCSVLDCSLRPSQRAQSLGQIIDEGGKRVSD